ncbi:MAG: hypothetical protein KAR35_08725 [Candidatus Heimdallarchaeota archaeon]|nr:hypothetical protein [Candidatus Heimdallarchaeota archaeon]MCK5049440.1 hypothetical protein [Candidatus Heimdallarchaeota archaeon]
MSDPTQTHSHPQSSSLDIFQCTHLTCKEFFQPTIIFDNGSSHFPHLFFQCPYCKSFYSAPFTYTQENDTVGIVLLTAPVMDDKDSRFVAS